MRTIKEIEKDILECRNRYNELLREKQEAAVTLVYYKGKYIKYIEENYVYYMYVKEQQYSEWSQTYNLTGMLITDHGTTPEVALESSICVDVNGKFIEEIHKDSFILKYNEVIQTLNNEINNWE